jgi:hypothetical protein
MLAPKIVQRPQEQQCPICRKSGECERHRVEFWQQGHRPDHLGKLLKEHPNAFAMRQTLRERFPQPEACLEGCVLVEREELDTSSTLPLFTGEALIHSSQARAWVFLYHPEGPSLLERYRRLVLAQLSRSRQVRAILKTLKREPAPHSRSSQQSLFEAPEGPVSERPEASEPSVESVQALQEHVAEAPVPDYVYELAEHLTGRVRPLPDEDDPVLYRLAPDEVAELGAFMAGLEASDEAEGGESAEGSRKDQLLLAEEMMRNLL